MHFALTSARLDVFSLELSSRDMGVDKGKYTPCSKETPVEAVPLLGRLLEEMEEEVAA